MLRRRLFVLAISERTWRGDEAASPSPALASRQPDEDADRRRNARKLRPKPLPDKAWNAAALLLDLGGYRTPNRMRHSLPIAPQFYVTAPQPCPYLDGRMERKLFVALYGKNATGLNDALSKQGFRRSQNVLYRPSCPGCAACLSARIRVEEFEPSKSQRRVARRNADLSREAAAPLATEERFALFRRYLRNRHAESEMVDMDIHEFASMIEETPVRSCVIDYFAPAEDGRRSLVAVCLTDVLDDGMSMVYSFYDPDAARTSLGTYAILDHVAIAREAGLPFVYLGYWVHGSPKMDYKSNFGALEIYRDGDWRKVGSPEPYSTSLAAMQETEPVADQVAEIVLPGSVPVRLRIAGRRSSRASAGSVGVPDPDIENGDDIDR